MQLSVTTESAAFAASCRQYLDVLKVNEKVFLCNQAMLLTRTIINFTPPSKKSQMAAKMRKQIDKTFGSRGTQINWGSAFLTKPATKTGKGSIRWYDFKSNVVRGIQKEMDLTDRGDESVYQFYLAGKSAAKTQKGMFKAGNRGKQNFRYWMSLLISNQQKKALQKRLEGKIGRLKAGWLPAYFALKNKVPSSLHGRIPQWVTNHATGAMGDIRLQLSDKNPSIDLINSAKGVRTLLDAKGGRMNAFRSALQVRAKAMANDIKFALAEPKKWILRSGNEGYWRTDAVVIDV